MQKIEYACFSKEILESLDRNAEITGSIIDKNTIQFFEKDFLQYSYQNSQQLAFSVTHKDKNTYLVQSMQPPEINLLISKKINGGYVISNPRNESFKWDVFETSDLFNRIRTFVETDLLRGKKVVILGLGTGGGYIALGLTKLGVGKFTLIDGDRLEIHNISRHVCDLSDLGRLKTDALESRMRNINPRVTVEKVSSYILKHPEDNSDMVKIIDRNQLEGHILDADLIISATGTRIVNFQVNELCVNNKKAFISGGLFEKAIMGYVFRYIPEKTHCYNCVVNYILPKFLNLQKDELDVIKSSIDYSTILNQDSLRGEPGLGVNINFLNNITVKLALTTLLQGEKESKIDDLENNLFILGNKKFWIFKDGIAIVYVSHPPAKECALCSRNKWDRKNYIY